MKSVTSPRQLLVLGGLMTLLLAVQPWLWRTIEHHATRLRQQQATATQVAQVSAHNTATTIALEQTTNRLQELNVVLAEEKELTARIEELERLAAIRQLQSQIIGINEDTSGQLTTALIPIVVSAEITGSSEQLTQYLSDLERHPALILVREWQLLTQTPAPDAPPGSPPPAATLKLAVLLFRQPPTEL